MVEVCWRGGAAVSRCVGGAVEYARNAAVCVCGGGRSVFDRGGADISLFSLWTLLLGRCVAQYSTDQVLERVKCVGTRRAEPVRLSVLGEGGRDVCARGE